MLLSSCVTGPVVRRWVMPLCYCQTAGERWFGACIPGRELTCAGWVCDGSFLPAHFLPSHPVPSPPPLPVLLLPVSLSLSLRSLSLSPLLPVATLAPIGALQKNPQGAAVIAQTLLHPYCCLYRQTSKKHRKAILSVCNSHSVYCLCYRLKARGGGS